MRISDWSSDVCSSDLKRLGERAGQAAGGRDDAAAAIDEVEAFLGMAHDRPDVDLGCRSREPDAAEAPANALQITRVHQVVDHLHQMVLREDRQSTRLNSSH